MQGAHESIHLAQERIFIQDGARIWQEYAKIEAGDRILGQNEGKKTMHFVKNCIGVNCILSSMTDGTDRSEKDFRLMQSAVSHHAIYIIMYCYLYRQGVDRQGGLLKW